jgi:hypothetical protein
MTYLAGVSRWAKTGLRFRPLSEPGYYPKITGHSEEGAVNISSVTSQNLANA